MSGRSLCGVVLACLAMVGCQPRYAVGSGPKVSNAAGPARSRQPRCESGLDGTFIQLTKSQLARSEQHWRDELRKMQPLGVDDVVIQFSGEATKGFAPSALLRLMAAARDNGQSVWLGLYQDPGWPGDIQSLGRLPAPLGTTDEQGWAKLCRDRAVCKGIYLGREIDDRSFSKRADAVRGFLTRTVAQLHRLVGNKPVAIAPFYTRRLTPLAYAQWWRSVLSKTGVDELWIQDGTGTGRSDPATARAYLLELQRAVPEVQIGAVVELFDQTAGPPWNNRPFAARPTTPMHALERLAAAHSVVEHVIAVSIPDYAEPQGSARARALAEALRRQCSATED